MSRMDKLNQLFKREVGNMLLMGEISDPRVKFVTITFVDISKDLSYAHVGFSVLSDRPEDVERAQEGLNSARGRIRKIIGGRVELRHIPEIKFVYDDTIALSIQMAKTLEEIDRERKAHGPAGQETSLGNDHGE